MKMGQEKQPVMFAPKFKATAPSKGIWTPGNKSEPPPTFNRQNSSTSQPPTPPPPPFWSPRSAEPSPTFDRKEFRPVKFESPQLGRKVYTKQEPPVSSPWSYPLPDKIVPSRNIPISLTNTNFKSPCPTNVPKSQHHTITLLQKAKEDQLPRSGISNYMQTERKQISQNHSPGIIRPNEIFHPIKNEYLSEQESENERPKKMVDLGHKKIEGIGPTTKQGMPIVLRSEVDEQNHHKWYKRMYNTLHKVPQDDGTITVRYKTRRGRYPYKTCGYLSEPEPNYDSDYSIYKYSTLDRRRNPYPPNDSHNNITADEKYYGTMPNPIKCGSGIYKNQPRRIEDFVPGHSSVSDKERKEWWDQVMEIFDGRTEHEKLASRSYTEGHLSRALKDQGYESDSTLVFRKRDNNQPSPFSPVQQKQAYLNLQAGGEAPVQGFRKQAPEKPKDTEVVPPPPPIKGVPLNVENRDPESPHRYVESDVNIHYKTPVRFEYKDPLSESELAYRQAEQMKKLYQEERRRKYLQELQDMSNRRHTDNFTQSQKSPIALNRYDDFGPDISPKSPTAPRTIARALYNFQGQSARELSFKKGDIIYVRREIDKNWYEGEHNAAVGLLPSNYVEIISKDGIRVTQKKSPEGQARAKFNFHAQVCLLNAQCIFQSAIELSLNKGELVTLTRRVDDNWFEGRIANRKGIFPVSYVDVLTDIGADLTPIISSKPIGSPAAHSLTLAPSPDYQAIRPNYITELSAGIVPPSNGYSQNGGVRETKTIQKTEVLHVDTTSDPVAYRAIYKYRPQNSDELELQEGDILYVLEKCDDGWFVGTSQRTGYFGTFPGNYVERN